VTKKARFILPNQLVGFCDDPQRGKVFLTEYHRHGSALRLNEILIKNGSISRLILWPRFNKLSPYISQYPLWRRKVNFKSVNTFNLIKCQMISAIAHTESNSTFFPDQKLRRDYVFASALLNFWPLSIATESSWGATRLMTLKFCSAEWSFSFHVITPKLRQIKQNILCHHSYSMKCCVRSICKTEALFNSNFYSNRH